MNTRSLVTIGVLLAGSILVGCQRGNDDNDTSILLGNFEEGEAVLAQIQKSADNPCRIDVKGDTLRHIDAFSALIEDCEVVVPTDPVPNPTPTPAPAPTP